MLAMSDGEITSAESSFDELARGVGDGSLSRRRALALVGSSLFGGTLGSLALLGAADAANSGGGRRKRRRTNRQIRRLWV